MNEMQTVLVRFIVIGIIINVGTVAFFFVLEEFGLMDWEVMYAVPLGIANGILMFIIHIKMERVRRADKEKEKLR